MTNLATQFYFIPPVEVVKVTLKNLKEAATWCGGKVATTESRVVKGRQDSYVWVPTPKGSGISWAFPGMFITKRLAVQENGELKATFSVFRKDYFNRNFHEDVKAAVDATWERQSAEAEAKALEARTITVVAPEGVDPDVVAENLKRYMRGHETGVTTVVMPADFVADQEIANPQSMVEQRQAALDEMIAGEDS